VDPGPERFDLHHPADRVARADLEVGALWVFIDWDSAGPDVILGGTTSEAPPLTAESVAGRSACAAVMLWRWLQC
jgi:hypothetical protein